MLTLSAQVCCPIFYRILSLCDFSQIISDRFLLSLKIPIWNVWDHINYACASHSVQRPFYTNCYSFKINHIKWKFWNYVGMKTESNFYTKPSTITWKRFYHHIEHVFIQNLFLSHFFHVISFTQDQWDFV